VASELLAAAEKYQMDELKDLCEEQLIASTDTGNAVAHFFLANRFKGQCRRIVFLSLLYMIVLVLSAEADNCCISTEVHYKKWSYPRIRIRLETHFLALLDPDTYWEYESGSRSKNTEQNLQKNLNSSHSERLLLPT
jgi:hypothetical protein